MTDRSPPEAIITDLGGRTEFHSPRMNGQAADEPGVTAAAKLAARLPGARMVRVDDLPPGFDAADLDEEDPTAWLAGRLELPSDDAMPPDIDPNDFASMADEPQWQGSYNGRAAIMARQTPATVRPVGREAGDLRNLAPSPLSIPSIYSLVRSSRVSGLFRTGSPWERSRRTMATG
jgi:hypothetical protein